MAKHRGGRPRLPIDSDQVLALYAQPGQTVAGIARDLGVDRSRVRRVVFEAGVLRDDRGLNGGRPRTRTGREAA